MDLPSLPYDFDHAIIRDIVIGPRREVTLMVSPIVWENNQGNYIPAIAVRFGGIVNFEQINAFFVNPCHNHTDLAWLRYDKSQHSKPDDLFFELIYERIEARVVIHCRNLSVTSAQQSAV